QGQANCGTGETPRPRLRHEPLSQRDDRIAGGYVPRLVDVDLLHDAIGERRRRCQPRQVLDGVDHPASGVELGLALGALSDVCFERRDTKAGLAVEQLVDLVWEEVAISHSVIVCGHYGSSRARVSGGVDRSRGGSRHQARRTGSRPPDDRCFRCHFSGVPKSAHPSCAASSALRSSCRARWMYVLTVPRGRSSVVAISSYDRPSTWRMMMQDRYSGRRAAIARSIAEPSSRASSDSRADGECDATSKEVASASLAVTAPGAPEMLTVGRRAFRRWSIA